MRTGWLSAALLAGLCSGCAGQLVEPGHRGLLFDPRQGGLKHEILAPGYYTLDVCAVAARCNRIDDFDISYQTKKEEIATNSQEGLPMALKVAVIYRPIISELYEMDTEIGPNYYDEVIGPEFRSAARGVFARHGYAELQRNNDKIEDEIEEMLRRRTKGKHVEIASVTMESITYAPEIAQAVQAKLVSEQEAAKQKVQLENDALRKKLEIEHEAEQSKLQAETELKQKAQEKAIAEQQAAIDKLQAETQAAIGLTKAKAEAEEIKARAEALAQQKRAEAMAVTPLLVQMHAYDALAALGGNGTTILLGDWSKVPNFLFPPAILGAAAGAGTKPTVGPAPRARKQTVPAKAPSPDVE